MKEVSNRLYVGGIDDFHHQDADTVVSATKTIHSRFVHAKRGEPEYIYAERDRHLMLNWVDGPAHLYTWSGPQTFNRALDFINRYHVLGDLVLIHCDQGMSRSPTLAMLFMAKRLGEIPNDPKGARAAFTDVYPWYQPGGIYDYVRDHWEYIT
jgi:predicted protein tyrosine phosphatase